MHASYVDVALRLVVSLSAAALGCSVGAGCETSSGSSSPAPSSEPSEEGRERPSAVAPAEPESGREAASSDTASKDVRVRWLTNETAEGEYRVRQLDAYLAIYFLARAMDRSVVVAHGDETAVVSGNWRSSQTVTALGTMGEAVGLSVGEVEFSGTNGDSEDDASNGVRVLLMGPASARSGGIREFRSGTFEAGTALTAELLEAEYANVLKLVSARLEHRLEKEIDRGRVSLLVHSIRMDRLLESLVHLSGTSVTETERGYRLSDSKLPSVSDRLEKCQLEEVVVHGRSLRALKLDASVGELYLAGIFGAESSREVVLAADPTRACLLGEGDTLAEVDDSGTVRAWRLDNVGTDEAELVEVTGPGGDRPFAEPESVTVSEPGE